MTDPTSGVEEFPLGKLMDEAVSSDTGTSYYKLRLQPEDFRLFTVGLILCVVKKAPFYNVLTAGKDVDKIPATRLRMRSVGATLRQAASRMSNIFCITTNPDLCIFATINPNTIDELESLMTNN